MKIALCTSDFFRPVQEVIVEQGHEVERVYTSCGLDTGFSDRTKEFADEMGAEFRVGRVTTEDIAELEAAGVQLVLAAAYDYKVPTPNSSQIAFINLHGSLLPEGRGPWPQPWILLRYPQFAGVTFHSMTQQWDRGDIVLQRRILLTEDDSFDSLVAKTLVVTRELTQELLENFYSVWSRRSPMKSEGSYWPKPDPAMRTINLSGSVAEARLLYRAFGPFTLFRAQLNGPLYQVGAFYAWEEKRAHPAGKLVTESPPRLILALRDGYLSVIPGPKVD